MRLAGLLEEGKNNSDLSTRVHAIIQALREERPLRYLALTIVTEVRGRRGGRGGGRGRSFSSA